MDGGSSTSGSSTEGGTATNGSATDGGALDSESSIWNTIFRSTNTSDGWFGQALGVVNDVKRYVIGFGDDIAQGVTSIYAGFRFRDLGDGYYSVYGRNNLNSQIGNWFYDRYRQYTFNGADAQFGPNSRRIGEARYNAFMNSNGLGMNVANSLRQSMNSSWNVFSRDFWSASNSAKLGGPVGMLLTTAGSAYSYTDGFSDMSGLASTDFAATLTSDVAIGVASTAVGSIASSMAAGAVAGSVVPGLGTIVGAGAGLLAGIGTSLFFNNTNTGRRIKDGIKNGAKAVYDGAVNIGKKAWDGLKTGFSNLGSLFGG